MLKALFGCPGLYLEIVSSDQSLCKLYKQSGYDLFQVIIPSKQSGTNEQGLMC
jgi:hypothetical protein